MCRRVGGQTEALDTIRRVADRVSVELDKPAPAIEARYAEILEHAVIAATGEQAVAEPEQATGAGGESETASSGTKLVGPIVDAFVKRELVERHYYKDGKVGNYEPVPQIDIAAALARNVNRETKSVKGFVSLSFDRLFVWGKLSGYKDVYKVYCSSESPRLLNWMLEATGDSKAFSQGEMTIDEYIDQQDSDSAEWEKRSRVNEES